MKDNRGFATSFILFSVLVLFLAVLTILLFTMNNSAILNSSIKHKVVTELETKSSKKIVVDATDVEYINDQIIQSNPNCDNVQCVLDHIHTIINSN